MVALDWAENVTRELQQFQFVFLILLRHVDTNDPLEHIIMQQHGRLEMEKVSPLEVKAILQGDIRSNILLMFDGYDEYTHGTNDDIDKLLQYGKNNCFVILSSRSGDFLQSIKSRMDEEVKITGFSNENIIKRAEQYLESKEKCQEFLEQAYQAGIHKGIHTGIHRDIQTGIYTGIHRGMHIEGIPGIYWKLTKNDTAYMGLLHIPIILHMACAVFREHQSLPSSKTGLFRLVVNNCISRTTLKKFQKTAGEVKNLHQLMVKLGKLAWQALNRENKQLLLYKVRISSVILNELSRSR